MPSSQSEQSAQTDHANHRQAPFWALWANPIFRRYCRSRLRPTTLGVYLFIIVLLCLFLCLITDAFSSHRLEMNPIDAARSPIIPLLILQGLILFLTATGQVAGAMTAEADEGVIDYQRLAPMTPLRKVLGYLFGLPVREYVLFFATLPFSVFCMWRGEVPFHIGLQLYAVFLSSAVLYHITGLVAGTVIKNRRWAFLVAMGVIFFLYTILPQIANFGLVYFKYFTLYPTLEEIYPHLINRDLGSVAETVESLAPPARFFNLDFPQAVFTIISQCALIFTGLVMVWRRWDKNESHLLGKVGAMSFFVWMQLVLLGNAIPLMSTGEIFPSREWGRQFGQSFTDRFNWAPDAEEALLMISAYGLVTLLLSWLLILVITPDNDGQIRGWRRRRKMGKTTLHPLSDPASSLPFALLLVFLGTGAWFIFTHQLLNTRWFPSYDFSWLSIGAYFLILFNACIAFQALLERKGKKFLLLAGVVVGIVPMMITAILVANNDSFATLGAWISGLSPLAGILYAPGVLTDLAELPLTLVNALPRAFWFWQAVWLLLSLHLLSQLIKSRQEIAKLTR